MEIGGTIDPLETLMYDPPNTLRTASMLYQGTACGPIGGISPRVGLGA